MPTEPYPAIKENELVIHITTGMYVKIILLGKRCSARREYTDSPGGPVAKILCSHCRGPGFDPWSGN